MISNEAVPFSSISLLTVIISECSCVFARGLRADIFYVFMNGYVTCRSARPSLSWSQRFPTSDPHSSPRRPSSHLGWITAEELC